ncbi:MAG TPA: rhodanese-like domain-containing protein [Candidatus Onthocola stercoravium]|nr:rhodanese-like domain-containing protein [Candidatus Onthocola stercoravium]
MKKIMISDYNPSMGILIDVQHPEDYKKNPTPNSKNMYADKLLLNYKTVLDKNQKYFIVCSKGTLSRRVVAMLEYLGYDVTQVIR